MESGVGDSQDILGGVRLYSKTVMNWVGINSRVVVLCFVLDLIMCFFLGKYVFCESVNCC